MPDGGADARAEQRATINRVAHELGTSPDLGELLEELRPFEEEHEPESFEAALIRIARRDYEKAVRVPSELRAELARAGSPATARGSRRASSATTRSCCRSSSAASSSGAGTSTASPRPATRTTCCSTTTSRG